MSYGDQEALGYTDTIYQILLVAFQVEVGIEMIASGVLTCPTWGGHLTDIVLERW